MIGLTGIYILIISSVITLLFTSHGVGKVIPTNALSLIERKLSGASIKGHGKDIRRIIEMLILSRQLKKLSPYVDWDKIHDEYMIATYSKESSRRRSLKRRERLPRSKGKRRYQWKLAMLEAKVEQQEQEAEKEISLIQQNKGEKKGEELRPKHSWGSKEDKGLSNKDQMKNPKEVPNDNAWSDISPPSSAPTSALPVAPSSMDFPSVKDSPIAPITMKSPSVNNPPIAPITMNSPSVNNPPTAPITMEASSVDNPTIAASSAFPESNQNKKGTMKRQKMGNSSQNKLKGFKKQQQKNNPNMHIVSTTPNSLVNTFSKESPSTPNAQLIHQSPAATTSSFPPSHSFTGMKKGSSRPLTAGSNSSELTLEKDEFPLHENSKMIKGGSIHDLVGNILEDAKSIGQMDERQVDDSSFNGKPIPVYSYGKGKCPDVGDVAQLPCAPDDLEKLCNKYDDMGSFKKCFEACKPSFCCIHDAPPETNEFAPNCNKDVNCAQYAYCYVVWWKLHDTVGPATSLKLEQNDDFFDIKAEEIQGDQKNSDLYREILFHHFDDSSEIVRLGTVVTSTGAEFDSDLIFLNKTYWDTTI